MPIELADIGTCLVGFLFPYGGFLTFRPPFNLRLDTSNAGRFEKLSYRWLKPVLGISGVFAAAAAYTDRHSDNAFIFGFLLAASFATWLFTVPAGSLAFRQNYGWYQKRRR
jgi:hypothetical protein